MTANQALSPDLFMARSFLTAMAEGDAVTFQTFDDSAAKNKALAKIFTAQFEDIAAELTTLNRQGAGIFWMVNHGDGDGRRSANVVRIRAVFVDLDGAPLGPIDTCPIEPHAVVESSPGRWHAYWLVEDIPREDFKLAQLALAMKFGGDTSVHDLPRVMRLPGFMHQKREATLSALVRQGSHRPYKYADLLTGLDLQLGSNQGAIRPPTGGNGALVSKVAPGGRHKYLASLFGALNRRGATKEAILAGLQAENQSRCEPPLDSAEVSSMVEAMFARYRSQHGSKGVLPDDIAGRAVQSRGAVAPNATEHGNTFRLLDVRELMDHPVELRWLVDGMIETPGVGAVIGASGSGKSFITIDLACSIATGTRWIDKTVEQGAVIYIAGEGKNGLVRRVGGWQRSRAITVPHKKLFLNGNSFELEPEQRRALARKAVDQGIKPVLIVLDTLARTFMPGEDENSATAMMQYIREADALRDEFDCVVLIVHHTGHLETGRARGSSAFRGALDLEMNVLAEELRCTKAKEAEPFEPIPFKIEPVMIDDKGNGSAAVAWNSEGATRSKKKPLTPSQKLGLTSLEDACVADGEEQDDGRIGVHLDKWRERYYSASTCDNAEAKRKAFQRARSDLVNMGLVMCRDDNYAPIDDRLQDVIATSRSHRRDSRHTGTNRDMSRCVPYVDRDGTGHTPMGVSRCPDVRPIDDGIERPRSSTAGTEQCPVDFQRNEGAAGLNDDFEVI
jgi:hypothetical protein